MADVNFTAQERSSCQNNALCVENLSISRLNAHNAVIFDDEILNGERFNGEVWIVKECVLHRFLIEMSVRLSPRPAHSRTFRAVQQAELNARGIGNMAHQAVHRVNLPDKMSLTKPANGRIAGHFANCL